MVEQFGDLVQVVGELGCPGLSSPQGEVRCTGGGATDQAQGAGEGDAVGGSQVG